MKRTEFKKKIAVYFMALAFCMMPITAHAQEALPEADAASQISQDAAADINLEAEKPAESETPIRTYLAARSISDSAESASNEADFRGIIAGHSTGTYISSNIDIVLTDNITLTSGMDLMSTADGSINTITIDGGGHTITFGVGTYGIFMNRINLVLYNVTVTGYSGKFSPFQVTEDASLTLDSGTKISNNTGVTAGAVLAAGVNSKVIIRNGAEISDNKSTKNGGAISAMSFWMTRYTSSTDYEAHIGSPSIEITDALIRSNSAENGGAIYISAGDISLNNATINYNTAYEAGGAIMMDRANEVEEYHLTTSDGNKVTNLYKSPLIMVYDAPVIEENTALFGGGLYLAGEHEIVSMDDTRIYVDNNTATLDGGGLLVTARNESKLSGVSFNENTAFGYGNDLFVNGFKSGSGNPNSYNGFNISGLNLYDSSDYMELKPGEGMYVDDNVYLYRAKYEYGSSVDFSGTSHRSYMTAKDSEGKYFLSWCLQKNKHSPREVPSLSRNVINCLTENKENAVKALIRSWCTDGTHPERMSVARFGTTDKSMITAMIPDLLALQHSVWIITEAKDSSCETLLNAVKSANDGDTYYQDFAVSTLVGWINEWKNEDDLETLFGSDLAITEDSSSLVISSNDFVGEERSFTKTYILPSNPISALAGRADLVVDNAYDLEEYGLTVSLNRKDATHTRDYIVIEGTVPAGVSRGKWLASITDLSINLRSTERITKDTDAFKNLKQLENGASQNTAIMGDSEGKTLWLMIPLSVTVPEKITASYNPTAIKYLDDAICRTNDKFSFSLVETDKYWNPIDDEETATNDDSGVISFSGKEFPSSLNDYKRKVSHYYVMYENGTDELVEKYYLDSHIFFITVDITGDEMEEVAKVSIEKAEGSQASYFMEGDSRATRESFSEYHVFTEKVSKIEFRNQTKEFFSLTVGKQWNNSDNNVVTAPTDKVYVGVYVVDEEGNLRPLKNDNGLTNVTAEVSSEDNWRYTFDKLLRKDKEGNLINYAVRELDQRKNRIESDKIFVLSDITGNEEDGTVVITASYIDVKTPASGNIADGPSVVNMIRTKPALIKKVLDTREHDEDTWEDANNVSIGEKVRFRMESFIPDTSDFIDDNSFLLRFIDEISNGLTFEGVDSFKIAGREVPKSELLIQSGPNGDKTRVTMTVSGMYRDLENAIGNVGDTISIEYTATLNEDAVIGEMGNENIAWLEYSDIRSHSKMSVTAKDVTKTYTGMLSIIKKDQETLDSLENVGFKLSGKNLSKAYIGIPSYDKGGNITGYTPREIRVTVANGVGVTDEIFTDKNGSIVFYGIASDDYTLTETTYLPNYKSIDPVDLQFTCHESNESEKGEWSLNEEKSLVKTVYNTTHSYLGSITITKRDAETGQVIPGVTFTLSSEDGSEILTSIDDDGNPVKVKSVSMKTDDEGIVRFESLAPANYILTETRAANGKSLLKAPVKISIPYEATKEEVEKEKNIDLTNGYYDEEKGVYFLYDISYTITDTAQFTLPVTGGIGSRLWLVLCILLFIGTACVIQIIISRKRDRRIK
ncbi:MAG: isopeptide-forming domain-containing fimbrial protein [Lachnospiraceae bacterium]|nr:isopeptide-forming domain-containing fimbrial protein [Lachnospiraceae bacterium]